MLGSYGSNGRATQKIEEVVREIVTLVHEDELPFKKDGGRKDTSKSKDATLLETLNLFSRKIFSESTC